MNIYYFSHQLINENHKNWYSTNKEKPQSSNTTVTIFFINHNNMLIHCSLPSPTPKNKKKTKTFISLSYPEKPNLIPLNPLILNF